MKAITFDGYDGMDLVCPQIHVWYDLRDRSKYPPNGYPIVAVAQHGDEGELLEYNHPACKVKVGDATGWVTYYFIKELKKAWQQTRLLSL